MAGGRPPRRRSAAARPTRRCDAATRSSATRCGTASRRCGRAPSPATSTARCARALLRAGLRCPSATGHAIGRSPQEAPTLRPGGSARLTPGMALVLEPAALAAGVGVRLAQTVVVTAGGAQPLTAFPPDLP